jgi:hypothetical protein
VGCLIEVTQLDVTGQPGWSVSAAHKARVAAVSGTAEGPAAVAVSAADVAVVSVVSASSGPTASSVDGVLMELSLGMIISSFALMEWWSCPGRGG